MKHCGGLDDAGRVVPASARQDTGKPARADALTSRKLRGDKLQDMENELRGTWRNFGLRLEMVSIGRFETRVLELETGIRL
jgi:hypothetical protein